ncbi:MAG: DUF4453 domain-containing protein [Pseudomonadota bacterium]
MRGLIAFFLTVLPATLSAQSFCEASWVARNMIFDRAGHCFSSALGMAMFDNSNCTGSGPTLTPMDQEAVRVMRDQEARAGCRVNTAAGPTQGLIAAWQEYARLFEIPAVDELGWACWGYSGPTITLHAGTGMNTPQIGQLASGQSLVSEHWPRNGWVYVSVLTGPGGSLLASGWTAARVDDSMCAQVAG